jgi:hypothetical protein
MPNLHKANLLSAVALGLVAVAGCTYDSDDKTKATTQPANTALRDPYGKWNAVNTDVSGGGTTNLNRDALKRDIDSILLK